MTDSKRARLVPWLLAVWTLLAFAGAPGCGGSAKQTAPPVVEARLPPSYVVPEPGAARSAPPQPAGIEIPVTTNDIVLGRADAPVTIVEFLDIECPFCSRVIPTLAQLEQKYGSRLRFVVKQAPLPFHPHARSAADATQAVLALAGSKTAFQFMTALMAEQSALGPEAYARKAAQLGVDAKRMAELAASPQIRAQVSEHLALAERVGATGTPAFRVNAIEISGAQPLEEFTRVIDAELVETDKLTRAGTPKERIYALRVATNFRLPRPVEKVAATEERDERTYLVPIGKSLTKGPANAPVTIVEFTDLECPFCRRAQETVRQVLERYPDRVRLVLKHNPLPFHKSADPAARLVIEARAQKGDAVAWDALNRIFETDSLSEETLLEVARALKLNEARVRAAWKRKLPAEITADQDLAADVKARGTPHFFINGKRLAGAQPLQSFTELVDAELARADALMKDQKIAAERVYAVLMEGATLPDPPERKEIPAPAALTPTRGPKGAPVLIQIFSDFQCPFCKRVLPTLEALEKKYGARVRFAWRDLPLGFHKNARPAAIAAREAFAQRGSVAFWKMHDLLFENQTLEGGLESEAFEKYAAQLKLDLPRFRQALSDGRHDAALNADGDLAKQNEITGTPSFVINGFYLSGAQPEAQFVRLIERALRDKQTKKAAPAAAVAK